MIGSPTVFDLPTVDGTVYVEFSPRLDVNQVEHFQATIQSIRSRQEMVEMLRWFAEQEFVRAEISLDQPQTSVALVPQARMPHRREVSSLWATSSLM